MTANEQIEKLSRENEKWQILELARSCKTLEEFIAKLETLLKKDN